MCSASHQPAAIPTKTLFLYRPFVCAHQYSWWVRNKEFIPSTYKHTHFCIAESPWREYDSEWTTFSSFTKLQWLMAILCHSCQTPSLLCHTLIYTVYTWSPISKHSLSEHYERFHFLPLLLLLLLLNLHFNHLLCTLWYPLPLCVSAQFFPDIPFFCVIGGWNIYWPASHRVRVSVSSTWNAHGKMGKLEHNMNVGSTRASNHYETYLDMLIQRMRESIQSL